MPFELKPKILNWVRHQSSVADMGSTATEQRDDDDDE